MSTRGDVAHVATIAGARFDLRRRLGAGGMGVVYLAHDHKRRIDVALKTMRRTDGEALLRFKTEFRSLAGIVHDNLVTLYELQARDDAWFFTMELVEGCDLLEFVRPPGEPAPQSDSCSADAPGDATAVVAGAALTRLRAGPGSAVESAEPWRPSDKRQRLIDATVDLPRLRGSLVQLVAAIAALHRSGKLHLDIKPSNVLVERGGRVVVCDFGLVTPTSGRSEAPSPGRLVGTPTYMAPEQAAAGAITTASDWYAVGVVLHEALTGRPPFMGNVEAVLRQKQTETPMPVRHWAPSIPPDLAELCDALLAIDPAARPHGEDILGHLHHGAPAQVSQPTALADQPVFIGRGAELDALRGALADSREHSVAVFVHGPSGFGKSALVRRFLDDLVRGGGAVVLEGRCYQRESVPYKALDALVDALSGHLLEHAGAPSAADLPADILALARLFPVLRRVPAIAAREAVPLPPDPQELRSRAFGALRGLLERLSCDRPTVVHIDDLHWGDVDSGAFLYDLIHHPAAPRVLFVATYRSDEAASSPLLQRLLDPAVRHGAGGDLRELAVAPLSEREVATLVRRLAGDRRDAGEERARAIARDAAGSPFFVIELARAGAASLTDGVNLDDVLGARIGGLPDAAQSLLRAAAVAARPIPVSLLAHVCKLRDEPALLAKLQAEHLVRLRTVDGVEELATYHDRIRETITARLSDADTRGIHRRLARALEASHRADAQSLVEHWLGAGERANAGRYAAKAAREAEAALAFDRAAHHYRLALELLELGDDDRRELQIKLGAALAAAGRLVEGSGALLAAAEGASPALALDLRRQAMEGFLRAGELDQGLAISKVVLEALKLRLPRTRLGVLASLLLYRAQVGLRGLRFRARPADEIPAEELRRIDMYWSLQTGLSLITPLLALAVQNRYCQTALAAGDPYRASKAVAFELVFRCQRGVVMKPQFARLERMATQLAADSGEPNAIGSVASMVGFAAFIIGDWRHCVDKLAAGERILRDQGAGNSFELAFTRLNLLSGLYLTGRLRELADRVRTLLREALDRRDEYLLTRLRAWRPNLAWLVMDDPDEARRQALSIIDLPAERGLHFYYKLETHSNIDLYRGDGARAWQRSQANWSELGKTMLLRVESVVVFSSYTRGRCALAGACAGGNDRAPVREALRMARKLENLRADYANGFAGLLRAGAAALSDDRDAAVSALHRADDEFERNDMAGFAAVASWHRGRLVQGDEGAALVAAADQWFEREAVSNPAAWCNMLAPGLLTSR